MPDATRSQQPTLLDEVRKVLRLHHYSMHTERSSVEWIVRFVRFHGMRSRANLFPAEPKIESFLTDLAVHGNVAAATQNQAMNALVSLDKRVLNHAMEGRINAVRANKKMNVPVVMTREEVAAILSLMDGTAPDWQPSSTALLLPSAAPSRQAWRIRGFSGSWLSSTILRARSTAARHRAPSR